MQAPFSIDAGSTDAPHTIAVAGELDQSTAADLRRALARALGAPPAPVLVDLTRLPTSGASLS